MTFFVFEALDMRLALKSLGVLGLLEVVDLVDFGVGGFFPLVDAALVGVGFGDFMVLAVTSAIEMLILFFGSSSSLTSMASACARMLDAIITSLLSPIETEPSGRKCLGSGGGCFFLPIVVGALSEPELLSVNKPFDLFLGISCRMISSCFGRTMRG